jgi:hypothetical protein
MELENRIELLGVVFSWGSRNFKFSIKAMNAELEYVVTEIWVYWRHRPLTLVGNHTSINLVSINSIYLTSSL